MRDSIPHSDIPGLNDQNIDGEEMKLRKAPGNAFKVAIEKVFKKVFDASIQERNFSEILEKQRLVLIPKCNDAQDAAGYSPFCIIDTEGKLLEKIICRRLETIMERDCLSDREFSLQKGRSTVDAIEAVIAVGKEPNSSDR